ncbi:MULTISPECIES: MurR/RpiR family transcriptional regulator [Oceanobacillus]|nr:MULTISPECIES: MurR/RpiR family transcriptional regulator [Oceanobacillus]MBT2601009.1 MurR/RpiR family transcriptional regulator [Oceanobacillus sp. ISL-74]MBT2653540.1 MurR/RpiR family transcriptional regulator [Oceanobacillus sp. ISL-73]MCT1578784.1 MurR/RpiR family transcriptional regulator [Oceanobacillus kimchii]MCT2137766.1 MurR/RpiR family transcriptional regulator [Oceanobacillus kimchii]OEH53498.1 RpiR family transcriptional regulator [Oceanobacillus sp. E9]
MFTNIEITEFSDLEFSLYNFIVTHPEKVIYMRIRDLANETHVSPTSILRFCKKLGYDGFTEFKVQLKMYMNQTENLSFIHSTTSLTEYLERTMQHDYNQRISTISQSIAAAQTIIFIGSGTSGILAEYGSRYFSALKKFSLHINDPYFPMYTSSLENSVAIVLSVSGETESIINIANRAKEEGTKIISITNYPDCTLAKLSDYNLSYFVSTEYRETFNLTTQIPVIHLLESLAKETYKYINT